MVEKIKILKKEPRINRRISLFKPRKKQQPRLLVREYKNKSYKQKIINAILISVVIFVLVVVLYILRNIVLQQFLIENQSIQTPLGSQKPDDNQLSNILQNKGLDISNIAVSSNSANISFRINEKTQVLISKDKNIESQMDLLETIIGQLKKEGKEVLYVDLRYNNPIVKLR